MPSRVSIGLDGSVGIVLGVVVMQTVEGRVTELMWCLVAAVLRRAGMSVSRVKLGVLP